MKHAEEFWLFSRILLERIGNGEDFITNSRDFEADGIPSKPSYRLDSYDSKDMTHFIELIECFRKMRVNDDDQEKYRLQH